MQGRLTFDHVTEINRQRCSRWHPHFPNDDKWNGADWSNAMQGEAGEAGNVVKKLRRLEEGFKDFRHTDKADELLDMLADEIADTYLYLDLLASYYGVDIPAAICRKFNEVSVAQQFPERIECDGTTKTGDGKTIYVSGPMRGYRSFNFPAFDAAAMMLREDGWNVLSPAEHDREEGLDETNPDLDAQGFDYAKAFHWDVSAILRSDAIALLPGWRDSVGARSEALLAADLRLQFYVCGTGGFFAVSTPQLEVVAVVAQ